MAKTAGGIGGTFDGLLARLPITQLLQIGLVALAGSVELVPHRGDLVDNALVLVRKTVGILIYPPSHAGQDARPIHYRPPAPHRPSANSIEPPRKLLPTWPGPLNSRPFQFFDRTG